jgi:hypothetical protein
MSALERFFGLEAGKTSVRAGLTPGLALPFLPRYAFLQ